MPPLPSLTLAVSDKRIPLRNAGAEVPTSTGASTSHGCKKTHRYPIAKVSAKPFKACSQPEECSGDRYRNVAI